MQKMEEMLTGVEVAGLVGLTRTRVLQLARDGVLPAIDVGGGQERASWRFRRTEIVEWLQSRRNGAA